MPPKTPPKTLDTLGTVEQVGRLAFDLLFGDLPLDPAPKKPAATAPAEPQKATVDTDGVSL